MTIAPLLGYRSSSSNGGAAHPRLVGASSRAARGMRCRPLGRGRAMPARQPQSWGFWTERKLAILEDYLPAFTRAASKKARGPPGYIGAFAGEGTGISRIPGAEFDASARLALKTNPPFTKLRFCEKKPRRARQLEETLRRDFPDRIDDFEVLPGDCNEEIPRILERLRVAGLQWAPTFAFLAPYGMQVDFRTLQALAEHKRGYRAARSDKPEYKVELWLLFPSASINRVAAAHAKKGIDPARDVPTRMFGTQDWRTIYDLRQRDRLTSDRAIEEYVNLMRWQLQQQLDYQWTHPLQINDLRPRLLYHMILATDNEAGTNIMSGIYSKAAVENPRLYDEAKHA